MPLFYRPHATRDFPCAYFYNTGHLFTGMPLHGKVTKKNNGSCKISNFLLIFFGSGASL